MRMIKRSLAVALSVIMGVTMCFSLQDAQVSAAADRPVKMVMNISAVKLVKGQRVELCLYDRNAGDFDEMAKSTVRKGLKWRSSNKKVATVTQTGTVKSKKAGRTTIKATYKGKVYTCKIRVYKSLSKKKREKIAKKEAKRIVRTYLKPSMSKREKAYRLMLYLYMNTYSQHNQSNSAYKKNYGNEAYAALYMHLAACSGFCKAYKMLCKEAKIKCKHTNAGKWMHQWNEVKIGGKWEIVDTQAGIVTFDVSEALAEKAPFEMMDQRHLTVIYQKIKHGMYI